MSDHRAYQLYAHITWHTWKRVGCIDQNAVSDIDKAIDHASEQCGVRVIRRAVLADHVHLLVSFRPSTRLSNFMSMCKGGSAYLANQRVPGAVRWARGWTIGWAFGVTSSEALRRSAVRSPSRSATYRARAGQYLTPVFKPGFTKSDRLARGLGST